MVQKDPATPSSSGWRSWHHLCDASFAGVENANDTGHGGLGQAAWGLQEGDVGWEGEGSGDSANAGMAPGTWTLPRKGWSSGQSRQDSRATAAGPPLPSGLTGPPHLPWRQTRCEHCLPCHILVCFGLSFLAILFLPFRVKTVYSVLLVISGACDLVSDFYL